MDDISKIIENLGENSYEVRMFKIAQLIIDHQEQIEPMMDYIDSFKGIDINTLPAHTREMFLLTKGTLDHLLAGAKPALEYYIELSKFHSAKQQQLDNLN